MNILDKIEVLTRDSYRIAVGVRSDDPIQIDQVLDAAEKAEKAGFGKIIIVGQSASSKFQRLIVTEEPEQTLIELIERDEVGAVVRGTAKASLTVKLIKEKLHPETFFRIALLETSNGHQFFFAPVGIDEGGTSQEKLAMISSASNILEKLGITPEIAVISGGRMEDKGRSNVVDRTLEEGEILVNESKKTLTYRIAHYGILIEEAVKAKANFILAPDGISGNLIYRTLIHLGSGKSHGAICAGIKHIMVDTSRSAPMEEYLNAIRLASALISTKKYFERKPFKEPEKLTA